MGTISAEFGLYLKRLRVAKGLTQQQLAEKADLSIGFLGSVERGEKSPTLESLQKIASAMDMTLVGLMSFQTDQSPTDSKRAKICQLMMEYAERISDLCV